MTLVIIFSPVHLDYELSKHWFCSIYLPQQLFSLGTLVRGESFLSKFNLKEFLCVLAFIFNETVSRAVYVKVTHASVRTSHNSWSWRKKSNGTLGLDGNMACCTPQETGSFHTTSNKHILKEDWEFLSHDASNLSAHITCFRNVMNSKTTTSSQTDEAPSCLHSCQQEGERQKIHLWNQSVLSVAILSAFTEMLPV